jgi:S1-C subfamily serine protease
VNDALGSESQLAGNMFVPIDLLKSVLSDLVARGKSSGSPRPWLGVQTQEVQGNVIVTRVSPDSPADKAAMRAGDVIVAVGGETVTGQADFYTRLWSRGAAGVEVRLDVLRRGTIQRVMVTSADRESYYRLKPTF